MDTDSVMRELNTADGRRNPYPHYAELHRHGAAFGSAGSYPVVVHGYDAINEVLRDPAYRTVDTAKMDELGVNWRDHPSRQALLATMFYMNGADHLRLRASFSGSITPRRVSQLRGLVVSVAENLMDRMATQAGAEIDFMAEFAFQMPGDVICELMGVPIKDRAWFLPRVHIFSDLLDLGSTSPEKLTQADTAASELVDYFATLVARRRQEPQDDLITEIARSGLDDDQVYAGLLTFFNAGYANTSYTLGKGLVLLLAHPEAVEFMARGATEAEQCVEEILRYEPPGHFIVRYAAEDREIAGVPVPAGSRVLLLIGAGNHDPNRYPNPTRFDPTRTESRPLTFGAGVHFCLGAPLTRLEGAVAFPLLFQRFPNLKQVGEPVPNNRLTQHGYHRLTVTL